MKDNFKKFIHAFDCAGAGLKYALQHERNLRIHLVFAVIVVIFGFFFQLSANEWAILILLFGVVMSTEIINTAIETTVDLVTTDIHPLAKIAKDAAAAAVLVTAFSAVIIGLIIFLPKIYQWIIT